MPFKQSIFKGYDKERAEEFYISEFYSAKNIGFSDEKAHEHAEMMLDYYGHHFRKYE